MALRNSPRDIQAIEDLNQLDELVVDKRLDKRASAKRTRRNRHYEKQFIRNALVHLPSDVEGLELDESHC
jgi:hypothetical protein